MRAFLLHADACPPCRGEFEAESFTKSLVCGRLRMVCTPSHVMEAVTDRLRAEAAAPAGALRVRWRSLSRSVYFRPALLFAAACAAVIILLRTGDMTAPDGGAPSRASLFPGDVIQQSLTNYRAVVNGSILPEIRSSEEKRVLDFFTGKTEFPVMVPRMRSCELVGGVLNEYAGVKLAHVVYRHDREVVYVYQVCWEEVQRGERVNLPAGIRDHLRATGWYSSAQPDGYAIVLWTTGRTLCSAVARMPREELLACMTESIESLPRSR